MLQRLEQQQQAQEAMQLHEHLEQLKLEAAQNHNASLYDDKWKQRHNPPGLPAWHPMGKTPYNRNYSPQEQEQNMTNYMRSSAAQNNFREQFEAGHAAGLPPPPTTAQVFGHEPISNDEYEQYLARGAGKDIYQTLTTEMQEAAAAKRLLKSQQPVFQAQQQQYGGWPQQQAPYGWQQQRFY